ncbi:MAG: phage tail sheath family protein [Moorea sp. SIOASIH]|uniref:phage tail sheath family protein n=1 Tax=Moorena sp. SIOASIH TaxID=2607817 RepID=UPI0013BC96A2|nr:phage tail sheath subtilisin-like domain-containing protein [Moorena sp. SIOASIH]NEO37701.1 phage tail sheath family protein [Moorena sp. SIOASIH]
MPTYLSPGVYVEEVASGSAPIAGVGTSTAGFIGAFADSINIVEPNPDYDPSQPINKKTNPAHITTTFSPVNVGEVKLCTNFSEFKKFFGNFTLGANQNKLVHAVYGFFNNGGTRCYVVRVLNKNISHITAEFLEKKFGSIDEIAIVAAPGITDKNVSDAIITHCQNTQDRFAILDSPSDLDGSKTMQPGDDNVPGRSDYAAFYLPWIQVFDPATKMENPNGDGLIYVPPSGHLAGIYARVDQQRGVHKAPANETIRGALGLQHNIGKAEQGELNKHGINCIRNLNGNIRVWGARTLGGDANGEFKYINVRRLFNYLRESIDEGTQWSVFEPNNPELWSKITRNVNAFLTNMWSTGALFGNTPEEAFYVKCDEETNPPEVRDLGQVVTEIGVAVAKPAEFVIFRISQLSGSQ